MDHQHYQEYAVQHHSKPFNGQFVATIGKYILSFLCGVLVAAYTVGVKSSKLDELLVWKGEISASVDKMNDEGTRASKNALQVEAKEMGHYEERLKKTEDATAKIDTMSYKLDNLISEIHGQKH